MANSTGSVFDVRDYGAIGDGVHNDREAIQAAADAAAAAGGGTVYMSAGIYILGTTGVNKSSAGIVLKDNVSLLGDGQGVTTLKVADGNSGNITGMVRTPFGVETQNVTVSNLTLDGNRDSIASGKVDGFYCGTEPGSTKQDSDITIRNVEIMDCSGYGFDPHEQTVRLTIENSVAHGNGLDGFTLDFIIDSNILNNVSYDNDRHGFNVVTSSRDSLLAGNVAYGNGGNGVTVQRGGEDIPSPHDLIIRGGEVYDNERSGILLQMTHGIRIEGVYIHDNAREGIKLYGSSDITIANSRLENNSQASNGAYSEILLTSIEDSVTGHSWTTSGAIITQNTISETGSVRAGHGVRESVDTTGSEIDGNTIGGATKAATLTGPQVRQAMADLDAPAHDFSVVIPATAYVDIDVGDSVTLSLQRTDAAGQLVAGGALPDWLSFDPETRTVSGTPTADDAGTLYLRIAATDKSGNVEYDPFVLKVGSDPLDYSTPPTVAHAVMDQKAEPGVTFQFALPADTFADPDLGDALTLSADLEDGSPLPAWLTFDTQSGSFSGTPPAANAGLLHVRITATDRSGASASDVFVVDTASRNDAPVVSQPLVDQNTVIGQAFRVTIPEQAFTDADPGDTLSYSAAMADGAPLPNWLSFDPATRTLSGTANTEGVIDVRITATDSAQASTSDVFTVAVAAGAQLNGGGGDDVLTGTAGGDTLRGFAGADRLDGKGGADTMIGGDGDDVYVVDDAGDVVTEVANNGAGGTDRVEAWISYTLANDVENLTLMGSGHLNGTGNNKANQIIGNAGDNTIDGGAGNDTMAGGAGDDTYRVGQTADQIVEVSGEGVDTVISTVSYTLSANLETLILDGAASTGTGNDASNILTGNAAANKLYGLSGADTIDGGAGADSLYGGAGDDLYLADASDNIVELAGEGTDTVSTGESHTLKANVENLVLTGLADIKGTGNASANTLSGNSAANTLSGQAGDDILVGRAGADTLTGGGGADRFVFLAPTDSTASQLDLVTDLKPTEGDRIDVSGIDANPLLAGDQAFTLMSQFSGHAGEVTSTFNAAANRTVLAFDIDGDGLGNEFSVHITGSITGPDWLLL